METDQQQSDVTQSDVVLQPIKTKNPKRVEAGKKGAAARKANALLKQQVTQKQDTLPITKITKDTGPIITGGTEPENITVYKNYIPLCLVGVAGVGLYMYSNMKPVLKQPVLPSVVKQQPDPFEF